MADNLTAFEMITSRVSNYADMAVNKYQAVAIAADGRYTVAEDATKPFIGICQYGEEAGDRMITVVRGIFPGIAGAAITAGKPLMVATGGKFVVATTGNAAVGFSLSAASGADELVAVQILDTPFTVS